MKKLIGHAAVDSGQLMICDPCYINSEWGPEEFLNIQLYRHKKTKRTFMYTSSKASIKKNIKQFKNKAQFTINEVFTHYNHKTSTGETMNEMIALKTVTEVKIPEKFKQKNTFSYAGICETTLANEHQINFKLGHPGVAVAFNPDHGDGFYPVYGTFNKDGICTKVEIICK